jgi:hypothetical protein
MREKFKQVQLSIVPPLIIFWKRVPEQWSKALLHLEGLARKFGNDSFSIKQKDTAKSLTNISQKKKIDKQCTKMLDKFTINLLTTMAMLN